MSYDIGLYYDDEPAQVDCHTEGGTYPVYGITSATLNITYNYAQFYYDYLDTEEGIRWLYGKRAGDTIARLEYAIKQLGKEPYCGPHYALKVSFFEDITVEKRETWLSKDFDAPENADLLQEGLRQGIIYDTGGYWKPTLGNAGYALSILLAWAKQHPDAVWEGD